SLSVTPAALTITGTNATKVYGAPLPSLTASYSGFVNGDTAASLSTAPSLATTATATSTPGTYPVTIGGAVDPDYTIGYVNGTLTVVQASPSVTVGSSANPSSVGQAVTFTATVSPAYTGTLSGSVQFQVDAANFGAAVALSGGTASFSIASLSSGSHTI